MASGQTSARESRHRLLHAPMAPWKLATGPSNTRSARSTIPLVSTKLAEVYASTVAANASSPQMTMDYDQQHRSLYAEKIGPACR